MTTHKGSKYLSKSIKRTALSVALGMCVAGGVQAQSTTGGVYGTAPAGSTITISNNSGLNRTITVDANGRYSISSLPVGSYTVTSGANKRDIVVTVGGSANVSFGDGTTNLDTVTVTGTSIPVIDITQTDTRTVITAQELSRMPIARTAEAIALLSPGAVPGNGAFFANDVSFGGASVGENAYYINGYFSGNPITNVGGFQLPYGSIEQQETYTGGYGAKYGRSAGGVISQVGKSGNNEFHFGGQVVIKPRSLVETRPDRYYTPPGIPAASAGKNWRYWHPGRVGTLYDSGKNNQSWENTYSAYVSGPLIKDKLFGFLSYETTLGDSTLGTLNEAEDPSQLGYKRSTRDPKMYAKLNWNITDNHLLEYTHIQEKFRQTGDTYNYDFANQSFLDKGDPDTAIQEDNRFDILKYTGYLTDNLTLNAMYGKSKKKYNEDPYLTGFPLVNVTDGDQNPAIVGDQIRFNNQIAQNAAKDVENTTDGLRLELEYVLGRHTLSAGIDNSKLEAANEGQSQVVDVWTYGFVGDDVTPIQSALNVGPTGAAGGGSGYYVSKDIYSDNTSMSLKQKAWYLEDRWQVTDNFLLSLGIRNDSFENFSDTGKKYVDNSGQWEPRLGFSWDVNGDSSFKVFGNAGRYYLAIPNAVAIRGVGASTFTSEYFTYTGIDANGVPTGLVPVKNLAGTGNPGPVTANGENGAPKDPLAFVPSDIKAQYQDEFVLGFQANLTEAWTLGAKLTRRELKSAIDDMCDPVSLAAAAGIVLDTDEDGVPITYPDGAKHGTHGGQSYVVAGCYMFNPGGSNTYSFKNVNGGDRYEVKINARELGPGMDVLKRNYSALDLFLEHPFDGKWEARFDYTYSRTFGNSEGPANSDTGQGSNSHDNGVATSVNYDAWQLMQYGAGLLKNDRTHVFKGRGSYAFTPEWIVGASATIASGSPVSCFGYYDPDGSIDHTSPEADPIGYAARYHTCFEQPWTPGKKRTPWTHRYDLNVTWKPAFADHKLAVALNVFNVANESVPTSLYERAERLGYQVRERLFQPTAFSRPRYVTLSVSYDW